MEKTANYFQSFSTKTLFRYTALAIIGLAFYLRLIGLNRGIWLDEYLAINYSAREGLLATVKATMSNCQLPAFYILLKFWSFIGSSEPFLRFLPVLCSVGTVAALIAWLKRYSYLAGLLAGFLFAASPNMLRYSQELRTYSLLMLAMAVTMLCISHIMDRPKEWWGYIGLTLSLTLAASAHLIGSMMLFAAFGYALLLAGNLRKIHFTRLIPAFALPSLTFLVLYLVMWQKLSQNTNDWWMPATSLDLLWDIATFVVGAPSIAHFIANVQTGLPALVILIQLGLATMGLAFIFLGQWRRSLPFLMGALLFWLPLTRTSRNQTG